MDNWSKAYIAIMIIIAVLCIYGYATDEPNTAIYVKEAKKL